MTEKHWPDRLLMSSQLSDVPFLPLLLASKRHVVFRMLAFAVALPWFFIVGGAVILFIVLPCGIAAVWYDVKDGDH